MTLPKIFPPLQWKVMIVDDDPDILALSKSSIKNIKFRDLPLKVLLADSEKNCHELLIEHPDVALIFIDVEMEHKDSGYRLIHHIRKTLNMSYVRLILRTGQAISKTIRNLVEEYDINDYLEKSVTNPNRFYMSTYTSLRSYKAIVDADENAERFQNESILKAQQLETFHRFVPQQLIPTQQEGVTVKQMLGVSSEMTFGVLFCDIRNFTSFAETISSTECFNFLNSYFSMVSPEVTKFKGFIYQLLGDGILAMYPCSQKNAARSVLHSAINIQDALHIYNHGRVRAGYEVMRVGVGANLGEVAIGVSGTKTHMSATAFGSTVNLASRCDDLSKQLSASIVVTEHLINDLDHKEQFLIRSLGEVRAKGLKSMTRIYEVFNSDLPEVREEKLKNKPITDEAFRQFSAGNVDKALSMFKALKKTNNIDPLPRMVIPLLKTKGSIYYPKHQDKKFVRKTLRKPLQEKSVDWQDPIRKKSV